MYDDDYKKFCTSLAEMVEQVQSNLSHAKEQEFNAVGINVSLDVAQELVRKLALFEKLDAENERLSNALEYIYESGGLLNQDVVDKARWGLGLEVENEQELKALSLANSPHSHVKRQVISNQGSLSPWDDLYKCHATAPFEWLWLAAQSAIESNFNPNAVSRAGAQGLMQLMPETAKELGVIDSFNPDQNIRGGAAYNLKQYKRWKHLSQQNALAFTFASYNAGAGHVLDAQRLAAEDGANPKQWFTTPNSKGVEDYIVLLEKAAYYKRPIVRHGYCRGSETRQYVRKIFAKHQKFQELQS